MMDAPAPHARHGRRARLTTTLLGMLALVASLALAAPAGAAVTPATLSMASDPGDYIGQGQTWSYDTAASDAIAVSGNPSRVHAAIDGANGDWWYLDLAAPQGAALTAGTTYLGATRYPFQAPSSPGLSVYGEGRGCNTLTGSFAVHDVAYGAGDVVTRLHATFEQHCEGAAPALRGTIDFGTPPPPPPPPMTIAATIDPTGTINRKTGTAAIGGTVTCSAAARATVAGTVTQGSRKSVKTTPFAVVVDCSPTAAPWRAALGGVATGAAKVDVTASAPDPRSGATVSATASATIEIRR